MTDRTCACEGCEEPARLKSKTCSRACADALRNHRPKPAPFGSATLCKSGSGQVVIREKGMGRPRKFATTEAREKYFTKEWNAKVRVLNRPESK